MIPSRLLFSSNIYRILLDLSQTKKNGPCIGFKSLRKLKSYYTAYT